MWIYTPTGFISAVAKRKNPTELTVRARDRQSLSGLVELTGNPATIGEGTDYPYRVVVSRDVLKQWLAAQVDSLDYGNFKDEASRVGGYEYASVLGRIWHDSLSLEDQESAQYYFDLSKSYKATR